MSTPNTPNETPVHRDAPAATQDDMRDEYTIDYAKARPNRFATHMQPGGRLIVLEPDVAQAFPTNEAVNTLLRAIMRALPAPTTPESTAAASRT